MPKNRKMNQEDFGKCIADLQQKCFEMFAPLSENVKQGSFDIGYGTISFEFREPKSKTE